MNNISGITLMMAIQAVNKVLKQNRAERDRCDADEIADYDDVILGYEKALDELKSTYEAVATGESNLPRYETLVS